MITNLVKIILNEGHGCIKQIIVDDFQTTKGTGLCNASLLKVEDKLMMNVRHVEYTLFYCKKFQSNLQGPLSYYHRDDDAKLRTNNYFGELDIDTLEFKNYKKIDTSQLDVEPKWTFIGLEDGRIVNWDNKINLVGVRRDTKPNGEGRMEFSEIENFKEVRRTRIEPPNTPSYCEKNWMPILDRPYHFIKWTNPTEVVEVDLETCSSKTVYIGEKIPGFKWDLRGGTPLIRWDDNSYVAIVHECYFTLKNHLGHKDSIYKHRFVVWDTDFNIKKISAPFDFMTGEIEFCIGMEQIDDLIIITFGFYDNACYAIKCSKNFINDLIWKIL